MSSILNADDIKKALDAFAGKGLVEDKSWGSGVAQRNELIAAEWTDTLLCFVSSGPNVSWIWTMYDLPDLVRSWGYGLCMICSENQHRS